MAPAQTFINLAVKDLKRSVEFYSKLGFSFNSQFTDENATCMIINENTYAMLLVEKFFASFLRGKQIADAGKTTEVLIAVGLASREEVDQFMEKGIAAGGREFREKQEYPWMYGRALEDIDGHSWEPFYMDTSKFPQKA